MSKYEDLREQTEAADGEQLSRLGALVWKAYVAGDITSEQMHQLDEVWHQRFAVLDLKPPQWWSTWKAQQVGQPDVIPLANLHRLDLKPGDRLAVIAPEWVDAEAKLQRFAAMVQQHLAEYADIQAIVFPPGTKLDVVSADRAES